MARRHKLDEPTEQPEHEKVASPQDVPLSEDYLEVETPVGKRHTWQVRDHDILASKNLESIFETRYRTKAHKKVVPLFDMLGYMFEEGSFAPPELDLGRAILYPEAALTDVISGVEGNLRHQGWVVSRRLYEILDGFNIGEHRAYKISVQSKKKTSGEYVYLHYYGFADPFVDFGRSKFYKESDEDSDSEARKPIRVRSLEDLEAKWKTLNKGLKFSDPAWTSILPEEIFLKDNPLDLFKFKDLATIDCFMSARLAQRLSEEGITGFKLSKTRMVKDSAADAALDSRA